MEGLATSAERDSIKYMQVKYMQDHKDQEFLGVISGVTEWEFLSKLSKINVKVCVESEI
jgi:exoribonuclease R